MINITTELKIKLLAAKSAEEVTKLVKDEGQEITSEDAAEIWTEITKYNEQEGKELSLDELEAVAGGAIRNRDYLKEGCAATVEPHSRCWGTDGGCLAINVDYTNWPCDTRCPKCGRYTHPVRNYITREGFWNVYACPECGEFSIMDT